MDACRAPSPLLNGLTTDGEDHSNSVSDIALATSNHDGEQAGTLTQRLPPELLGHVVDNLSIYDVARLVQVDKSLSAALASTTVSSWPHLACIAGAADPAAALSHMAATTTIRGEWKAPLLRALARQWHRSHLPASAQWNGAWCRQVSAVREWSVAHLGDAPAATAARDLLIAEWFAPHRGTDLNIPENIAMTLRRSRALPCVHWPAILGEMLPSTGYWVMRAEIGHFIASIKDAPSKIPDALRSAIANGLRENLGRSNVSAILHAQFDWKIDAQRRDTDSMLAMTIGARPLAAFKCIARDCAQWRPDDMLFLSLAENVFALTNAHHSLKSTPAWAALDVEIQRRMTQRLDILRAPHPGEIVGAWPATRAVTAAFLGLSMRLCAVRNTTDMADFIEEIALLPWPMQVEAMCRLIEQMDYREGGKGRNIDSLIGRVTLWSDEILKLCLDNGVPELGARAFTAAIKVRNIRYAQDQDIEYGSIFWMVRNAFAKLPAMYWSNLLDVLSVPDQRRWRAVDKQTLCLNVGVFLLDPRASAIAPSAPFADLMARVAGGIWNALPDRRAGPTSRFDVFCERVDLPEHAVEILRQRLQQFADTGAEAMAR